MSATLGGLAENLIFPASCGLIWLRKGRLKTPSPLFTPYPTLVFYATPSMSISLESVTRHPLPILATKGWNFQPTTGSWPSGSRYGQSLIENADLCRDVRSATAAVLNISIPPSNGTMIRSLSTYGEWRNFHDTSGGRSSGIPVI